MSTNKPKIFQDYEIYAKGQRYAEMPGTFLRYEGKNYTLNEISDFRASLFWTSSVLFDIDNYRNKRIEELISTWKE